MLHFVRGYGVFFKYLPSTIRALLAFADQEASSIESSTSSAEQTEDFILTAMTNEWTLDRICRLGLIRRQIDAEKNGEIATGVIAKWAYWLRNDGYDGYKLTTKKTVGTPLVRHRDPFAFAAALRSVFRFILQVLESDWQKNPISKIQRYPHVPNSIFRANLCREKFDSDCDSILTIT